MDNNNFSILIIDDEESMRDSCLQVLRKDGYNAAAAKDGQEGIEKARKTKPDIALVDLRMPGLGGMDVLLKLREIDCEIVPIVITGYASVDSAVEAMRRGAYDYLSKPFSPHRLRLIIKRAVEKRTYMRKIETLKQQKKLVEESFVALVSHQLRSPLATIQQYLEAILDGTMGDISDEQKRTIQRIGERQEALMTIINDWLNLASIKRGNLVGALEVVVLTDLLSDLVDFMQPQAENNKVAMRIRLPESFPAIRGDRLSLEQVFTNLISNAILYNRPNGSVFIDFMDYSDFITVEISDTGVGIEKELLPFLFDEFSPLAPVRRRDGKRSGGSGLGLAIAKRIVEAHGGTIEVDTVPEKGSTFTVSLPKSGASKSKR